MKFKTIIQSFINFNLNKNNFSKIIKYIAYIVIFFISINSIINTKDYIAKNEQKELKKIMFHSLISLIVLWTSIFFLIK